MPAMRLFLFSLLACAVLALTLVRAPSRRASRTMRAELATLEAEVAALRARNRALVQRARFLRTDPVALERVARQRYGLVRADEWVLPPAPSPVSAPQSALAPTLARSP